MSLKFINVMTKRREFIKKSALGSAGIAIGGLALNPILQLSGQMIV
jgi:hypothetical protein